eukprot:4263009-Prymnesium_polylepis.2
MFLWAQERDGGSFSKLPVHHYTPYTPYPVCPANRKGMASEALWGAAAASHPGPVAVRRRKHVSQARGHRANVHRHVAAKPEVLILAAVWPVGVLLPVEHVVRHRVHDRPTLVVEPRVRALPRHPAREDLEHRRARAAARRQEGGHRHRCAVRAGDRDGGADERELLDDRHRRERDKPHTAAQGRVRADVGDKRVLVDDAARARSKLEDDAQLGSCAQHAQIAHHHRTEGSRRRPRSV